MTAYYITRSTADVLAEYPEGPEKQHFHFALELFDAAENLGPTFPYIVGGFARKLVTHEPVEDSDIDITTPGYSVRTVTNLSKFYSAKFATHTHHKLKYSLEIKGRKVQILGNYTRIMQFMDDFDFTIAQFAFNREHCIISNRGLEDFRMKRLSPATLNVDGITVTRLNKFFKKGYKFYDPPLEKNYLWDYLLASKGLQTKGLVVQQQNDSGY